MVKSKDNYSSVYFRNLVFGTEDSLVSTVGLLSGIAVAGVEKDTILTAGIILIFVEAFSMGTGSFLSEESDGALKGSIVMFLSYFFSGFIPLFPYVILDVNYAFIVSIIFSLVGLFLAGIVSAKAFGRPAFSQGMKMLIIGGSAAIIGAIVGKIIG